MHRILELLEKSSTLTVSDLADYLAAHAGE